MLEKSIIRFSRNLENLRDFVEVIDGFLEEKAKEDISIDVVGYAPLILALSESDPDTFTLDEEQKKKIRDMFGDKISIELTEKEDNGKSGFKIDIGDKGKKRFNEAMERIHKQNFRKQNLYHSSLISLISNVECFISELIHHYYSKNPNAVGTKEKVLSLGDLKSFGNIEDAISHIVEGKVESILRGNFDDWIKSLRNDLSLSMSYIDDHKDILLEACLRRNLLVHNNGVVNTIYQKNRPCSIPDAPSIGSKLTVSSDYLEDKITRFEKIFILAAAELWKKEEPKKSLRGSILIKLAYDHLVKEKWKIAESFSYFVMGDKGLSEADRSIAQINYWQAKKWNNEFESVRKSIEEADFSAKDKIYSFAKCVLLDNLDEAISLLPGLLESKSIGIKEIEEWPLLRNLREEKQKELEKMCEPFTDSSESHNEVGDDETLH